MKVDLAIIGGGVAAASAVLALRKSERSIAIIAPPSRPGPRIGESLPAAANEILKDLGVWQAFLEDGHRPALANFSAWGTHFLVERNSSFHPAGSGWSLDRRRFEDLLWRQAAAIDTQRLSVELKRARRLADRGWNLELRDGRRLEARCLLDGSGRAAVVSRRLATRTRHVRQIAAYAFLPQVESDVTATPAVLIETTESGWWYSSLTPQSQLVVAFFFDPDLFPADRCRQDLEWRSLLRSAPFTWKRITSAGFAVDGPPALTDASSQSLDRYAGKSWAAAGDAAAALDPLASHGLTTALWSARRAALALDATLDGDSQPLRRYDEDLAAGISRYRQELSLIYAQERRFPESSYWRRRQSL